MKGTPCSRGYDALLKVLWKARYLRYRVNPAKRVRAWVNRVGRIDRPLAAALPACQSAAGPDRDADRAMQAGQATLGRAEDTRAAGPAFIRMSTPPRPDAGVPKRPRPVPDAHASLLKLPPPQNCFLSRDPGAGFAPSCLGE